MLPDVGAPGADHFAKKGADLRGGDKIAPVAQDGLGAVIAMHGVKKGHVMEGGHGQGTLGLDMGADQMAKGCHGRSPMSRRSILERVTWHRDFAKSLLICSAVFRRR